MSDKKESEKLFDGQRDGEEVVFIFRRHLITTRKGTLFFLIMVLIGIVPLLIFQGDMRMFYLFLIFLVIGLLGMGYTYILWYFSIYIVTNQRIRQVVQKGLFKKTVVDLGLDKIQSIAYNVPGVLGSIFDYGTVMIQTGVGDLIISMVAKPDETYNKLQDVVGKK